MTQRSIFSINRTKYLSKPQAFVKVTYHGFFECEGKHLAGIVLEIIIVHNIVFYFIFIFIFVFDVYFMFCYFIFYFILFHYIQQMLLLFIALVLDGIANLLFVLFYFT